MNPAISPDRIESAARAAWHGSSLYDRPWEQLSPERREHWRHVVALLATPKGERRPTMQTLIEARKRRSLGKAA